MERTKFLRDPVFFGGVVLVQVWRPRGKPQRRWELLHHSNNVSVPFGLCACSGIGIVICHILIQPSRRIYIIRRIYPSIYIFLLNQQYTHQFSVSSTSMIDYKTQFHILIKFYVKLSLIVFTKQKDMTIGGFQTIDSAGTMLRGTSNPGLMSRAAPLQTMNRFWDSFPIKRKKNHGFYYYQSHQKVDQNLWKRPKKGIKLPEAKRCQRWICIICSLWKEMNIRLLLLSRVYRKRRLTLKVKSITIGYWRISVAMTIVA